MQQSQPHAIRRSLRTRIMRNTTNNQSYLLPQSNYNHIDYALQTLDSTHALAYLKLLQQMSRVHYCIRANLAHKLDDHEHCLSFVRQCLKLNLVCQKCIQIFLEHHTEHQTEDNNLRKKIIQSIQGQNKPELSTFLQGLALIVPSYKTYKRLADDIEATGGQLQKILVMETSQNNRKIIAKKVIHHNQQILFIPKKMLITLELTKTLPLIENLLSQKIPFKSPKHNQLTIFILHQYQLGVQSPFYNYLSILPTDFAHFPVYYSQEMLSQLKGSHFLEQIKQKKQDLKKDYDILIEFDSDFKRFSFQSFVNTRLLVSSRVFGIIVNKVKTDAMVPYADMLNHHLPKQTSWFYCNESQGFVIQSLKEIPLGAEIFDSYGQKCNSRFLLNYGFTLEENLFNQINIEIELLHLLTRLREPLLIKIRVSKMLESKCFQQMISTLRMAAQEKTRYQSLSNHENSYDEDEVEVNIQAIKQTQFKSRLNQIQAWTILNTLMTNRLKQYKTTFAEDKKLLQNNKMDYNLRNIIILRKGQKQILLFYQKMAKKMMKYFSGQQKIKNIQQYEHYISHLRQQQHLLSHK